MKESPTIAAILEVLTVHIQKLPLETLKHRSVFLAETIHSLSLLLESDSKSAKALTMILSKKINRPLFFDEQKVEWKKMIRVCLKKSEKENSIDLHGLSHGLAKFYVGETLKDLSKNILSFRIIYGKASHSKHSENKMKEIVHHACKTLSNAYSLDWSKEGKVIIRRRGRLTKGKLKYAKPSLAS